MKFTITFTKEQLTVVDQALQQTPFYVAAPLIQEINKQIQEQLKSSEVFEVVND